MHIPNEIVTTKIWKQSLANLKILAAYKGETMTSILDRIIREELDREEKRRKGRLLS